jgi:hypothetical protein
LKPFEQEASYSEGSLLFRYYRDLDDQGHVAIVSGPRKIIHCYTDGSFARGKSGPGVVEEELDANLWWNFDYVLHAGEADQVGADTETGTRARG